MRRLLGRGWQIYRRWPLWAQVSTVILVLAVIGAAKDGDRQENQGLETTDTTAVEDGLPRAPTTPTTSTTLAPTSTSAPTTTATSTLPPTTLPPSIITTTNTTKVPVTVPETLPPPPPPSVAPEPEPTSGCHPSYVGACLPPNASDVDCAGGSGNGPVYATERSFGVVGPDVYDLDRDGNGLACES